MATRREIIRLPLQAGDVTLMRTAIALVVGSAFAAIALGLDDGQKTVLAFYGVCAPFGIAFTVFGMALAYRASDVAISNDDFTIEGGPNDATTFLWEQIDPRACHIAKGKNPGNEDTREHLWVTHRDGREFPIGNARGAGSRAALELMLQIICASPAWRAGLSTESTAGSAKPATTVLTCASCGGVLRPDAAATRCPYCDAPVVIPQELAARIDEVRKVRDGQLHLDVLVDRLLALPSARRTNVLVVFASVVMLAAIPTAAFATQAEVYSVTAVASGVSLAAFLVAWMHVVDRQALRVLLTAFAASAPRKAGEPERCRRCDAPLPAAKSDGAIARCVYCNADNVLGVDVGIRSELTRESTDLEGTLAFRARRRNEARVALALTALGTIAAFIIALRHA